MANIIWNSGESRLRVLWRLILFIIVGGLLVAPLAMLLEDAVGPAHESLANAALGALGIGLALAFAARFIDKRPLAHFGMVGWPRWPVELAAGTLISMLALAVVLLPLWQIGALDLDGSALVRFTGLGFGAALALQLLRYLAGSIAEEMFSRGYLLSNVADALGGYGVTPRQARLWACLVTALCFSLLHMVSGGTGLLSYANILLIGLLFGAGALMTGRLALPIGLHFGWNFAQNNLFGMANGGKASEAALFHFAPSAAWPSWLTGGSGGPEGGLMGTLAVFIAFALLFLFRRALSAQD